MRILRIFFTKTGEAAYISHLDLQRVMARALRKSGLPVWWSQGFNPHIYMTFALPLPLMHESLCESVDVKTESELLSFEAFVKPLSDALPRGIEVTKIELPKHEAGEIASAEYAISYEGLGAGVQSAVEGYNALQQAKVVRKTKRTQQEIDLKEVLPKIAGYEGGEGFAVSLPAGGNHHYSPALLTELLQREFALPQEKCNIVRLGVHMGGGEVFE